MSWTRDRGALWGGGAGGRRLSCPPEPPQSSAHRTARAQSPCAHAVPPPPAAGRRVAAEAPGQGPGPVPAADGGVGPGGVLPPAGRRPACAGGRALPPDGPVDDGLRRHLRLPPFRRPAAPSLRPVAGPSRRPHAASSARRFRAPRVHCVCGVAQANAEDGFGAQGGGGGAGPWPPRA